MPLADSRGVPGRQRDMLLAVAFCLARGEETHVLVATRRDAEAIRHPRPSWRSSCLSGVVLVPSRVAVPALLALLLASPAARAQQESGDRRARELFDEAGELERRGNWVLAQDRLQAALRIRETPHLRYALGWALHKGGKLIAARTEYEVALRLAQLTGNEEVSQLATARIAEVGRQTPLLQVRVLGLFSPDTRVSIDGRDVPMIGNSTTLAVDPGTHVVRIEQAGKVRSEQSVAVPMGALRVVDVKGSDGTAAITTANPPGERAESAPVLPWVFLGGGAALVGGGVLLLVASASDLDARDENVRLWCAATACVDGTRPTLPESEEAAGYRREAYDAPERGNTKRIIGGIASGIGVVGIAVGMYMLVKNGARQEAPRATGLRVDTSPVAGGGIVSGALVF